MLGFNKSRETDAPQPGEERQGQVFIAWDETGAYESSVVSAEDAIENLQETSDGQMVRVKRYTVPMFIPGIEEAGELDPAV